MNRSKQLSWQQSGRNQTSVLMRLATPLFYLVGSAFQLLHCSSCSCSIEYRPLVIQLRHKNEICKLCVCTSIINSVQ